jgi:hypothetical protein
MKVPACLLAVVKYVTLRGVYTRILHWKYLYEGNTYTVWPLQKTQHRIRWGGANLTSEAWVPSQVVHVGFIVEEVALEQVYVRVFWFYLVNCKSISTPLTCRHHCKFRYRKASLKKDMNCACKVHRTLNEDVRKIPRCMALVQVRPLKWRLYRMILSWNEPLPGVHILYGSCKRSNTE